jgi:hypothetical protein
MRDPDLLSTASDIAALQILARFERTDAADEILAQRDEFISYFMGVLGASPTGYPQTFRLLHFANLVGTFMAMHFKAIHRRERPSRLAPSLLPPLQVPGHASYPSGHATQAHLIATCAAAILPAGLNPIVTDTLVALADRIARNREIAGLHFHDDTLGGIDLAANIFEFLETDRQLGSTATIPRYRDLFDAAAAEWT